MHQHYGFEINVPHSDKHFFQKAFRALACEYQFCTEYAFGIYCPKPIVLSHEHIEYAWLDYDNALKRLKWDSNRTALYELNCRLCCENDI
jgi:hypothetical protein